MTALTRDYEILQQSYRSLLQKKGESQMSANLEKRQIGEQFKILDPARMPEKPASPDRPRLYLMALMGAIAAGFGAGALREFFDRTLRTEADVRAALNLMVLATVPSIRGTVAGARRWRRNLAVGAGALALVAVGRRGGVETVELIMYERYYGLSERPFDLSPNPRFLCFTPQHREALVHLEYGLAGQSGLTVLVGEAGTGKTTLIRAALLGSNSASTIVHLSNPTLTRSEFFEYLASGFGFSQEAAGSKIQFLRELKNALKIDGGPRLALVVDEAQSVPYELLEEIRLLTNSEANGRSLAVALVGQPELALPSRGNPAAPTEAARRPALRVDAAQFERYRRVYFWPHPDGGRRSDQDLHPRCRGGDSSTFCRHPACDQRDLRQRVGQRLRRGPKTRWRQHDH